MLVFDAFGKISFSAGRLEIFGAQNFGATFTIPGLITVGPNFKVYGVSKRRHTVLNIVPGQGV